MMRKWVLVAALVGLPSLALTACASNEIDPERPPLYDYEPPPLDDTPGSVVPRRI